MLVLAGCRVPTDHPPVHAIDAPFTYTVRSAEAVIGEPPAFLTTRVVLATLSIAGTLPRFVCVEFCALALAAVALFVVFWKNMNTNPISEMLISTSSIVTTIADIPFIKPLGYGRYIKIFGPFV